MRLLILIFWRILGAFFVLVAISVVMFTLVETMPGDFASATAPRYTPPDQIAAFREAMGLNVEPVARYFAWIGNAVQGDLGHSWTRWSSAGGRPPVASLLADHFANTAVLAAMAAAMAIPVGFCGAVLAVIFPGSFFDRASSATALALISLPEFVMALLLTTFFVVRMPIFPAHVAFADTMGWGEWLWGLVLPAASMALIAIGPVLRLTRACLLAIMRSDYIEMGRLKGLSTPRLVLRHALPNATPPIVNILVLVLGNFIVGAFIVEQIFSYPGIGRLMINAVQFRDMPIVLGVSLTFALLFVTLNLIADVVSILATPRLRLPL